MTATTKGSAKVTLPSDTEILITREFAAPRHLVYRAWTEPDLVSRWWHSGHGTMKSCEIDLRVGGRWRWAMDAHAGFEVAFNGEYLELVPGQRMVYTEAFEGMPGVEPSVTTLTFEESGGRTTLSLLARYPSQEVRDAVLASGMESGMQTGLDLLEELAASLS